MEGLATPHLLVCAELDPLADQALDYHAALLAAGAPSELWLARGTVHGFLNIKEIVTRRAAGLEKVAAFLRGRLECV